MRALALALCLLPLSAAGWEVAERIESAPGAATSYSIAVDEAGNAHALWLQSDGQRGAVWTNRYAIRDGWTSAHPLSDLDARAPVLSVRADGAAVAAWHQWNGTLDHVYAARYDTVERWGQPERLPTSGTTDGLTIASGGDTVAAWLEQAGGRWRVMATRLGDGGWSTPVRLDAAATGDADALAVAVADGMALVVWRHTDGLRSGIMASYQAAGQPWQPPRVVGLLDRAPGPPQLAMGPDGAALVVWEQWGGTAVDIWANRFSGGSWPAPVRIDNATPDASSPRLAMDATGKAVAAWTQGGPVWAARYTTRWGPANQLDGAAGGPVALDAAAAPDGSAVVVWHRPDGALVNVNASWFLPDSGWQDPIGLETRDHGAYDPVVSMDPFGNAVATWRQADAADIDQWGRSATRGAQWAAAVSLEQLAGDAVGKAKTAVDPDGNTFILWAHHVGAETDLVAVRFVPDHGPIPLELTSPRTELTRNDTTTITGTTRPGLSLTINGEPVPVTETGSFQHTATLAEGPNPFTITASDRNGDAATAWADITRDTTPPLLNVTVPSFSANDTILLEGQTEPGATVRILGSEVQVSPSGAFSHRLTLVPGANLVPVTATDPAGNRAEAQPVVQHARSGTATDGPGDAQAGPRGVPTWAVAAGAAAAVAALLVGVLVALRRRRPPRSAA